MSRIDGHCTGRGGDTTSLTAHCRRTEYRVLPDLEDRTTLTTASELEVRCILTAEAAPPSLGAGDRRNQGHSRNFPITDSVCSSRLISMYCVVNRD